MNITLDLFFNGKLEIYQSKDHFKSGSDAVLLSAFVDLPQGHILDVGCGTGVISMCLAYRNKNLRVTGIDSQPELIDLCTKSSALNKLNSQCDFQCIDIQKQKGTLHDLDAVVTNPPYFKATSPSPKDTIAKAKSETLPLKEWMSFCEKRIKPQGFIYCIYPATQMAELLDSLKGFGSITVFPLWPRQGQPAKRILVRGQKGSQKQGNLSCGLTLHSEKDNRYTPEATIILREGKPMSTDALQAVHRYSQALKSPKK